LVENGTKQHSADIASQFENDLKLNYAYLATPGKSKALNLGLTLIPPDALVLFTDDDIRFDKNWMREYDQISQNCVSGRYFGGSFGVDYETPPKPELIPLLPDSAIGIEYPDSPEAGCKFLGFNWAAFASDIIGLGGYDEKIGPGSSTCKVGDETEMQVRLAKAGVQLTSVPKAKVWHFVPNNRCSADWLVARKKHVGAAVWYLSHKEIGLRSLLSGPANVARIVAFSLLNLVTPTSSLTKKTRYRCGVAANIGWIQAAASYYFNRPFSKTARSKP
jgi:hypothetical protein